MYWVLVTRNDCSASIIYDLKIFTKIKKKKKRVPLVINSRISRLQILQRKHYHRITKYPLSKKTLMNHDDRYVSAFVEDRE